MTTPAEEILKSITERIKATASVDTLYGESRRIGNTTIIPVAKVSYGFGGGGGEGTRPQEGASEAPAIGAGGGGGGGVAARPVGYIVVSDGQVEYVSIPSWRGILVAGMGGVLVGLLLAKVFSE